MYKTMSMSNKTLITLLCAVSLFGSLSAHQKTEDLTQYVNPMIGTQEMGHVFPGSTVPFGMVQLSPDTDTIPMPLTENIQAPCIVTVPAINTTTPPS